ncbi:Putative 2-amino-3-ketobutyrate CoA ligase [Elusimicrobium minutum Pei191]|uniref:Putative 2-amino-3-ketobutyrate CoA ligase n=1 Tax=Elusimicrobium minutum (strain Pei191) TaxID=445932 RepID=B2KBM5_ELUMP|nr:glycine C-acetyltransferase [Elusimicrobium minutum]ACC97712.1 Putative 2-amino-3-ketobutyrate CoA ligase [Elusimicrobium minutum Pei191]
MSRMDFLKDEINKLKEENRFIKLRVLESEQAPIAVIDGKKVINLTSNNYLNLTTHPKVKKAAADACLKYGIGTAAVRTIIGTTTLHGELEKRLAEFKQTEAALVIQSGFTSNTAVCQSLMTSHEDVLISDELNHASIIDGGRLSKAVKKVYRHSDMTHLKEILESPEVKKARRRMLVTDGVFSMDGDIAKLPEIVELCERHDTIIMVDDAHSSGVLGNQGRGTVDHFDLKGRVDIQIGTLSKAFGTIGGYVAGCQDLRDYMVSTARPFLFSSSHPPSVIATCLAGLDVIYNEPELLEKLWTNTKFFKEEIVKAGFDINKSETPITPVMIGDTKKAVEFSDRLFEEGVFALSIGFPTVAKGKERLRNIITAGHEITDLERAVAAYKKVGKEMGLLS